MSTWLGPRLSAEIRRYEQRRHAERAAEILDVGPIDEELIDRAMAEFGMTREQAEWAIRQILKIERFREFLGGDPGEPCADAAGQSPEQARRPTSQA